MIDHEFPKVPQIERAYRAAYRTLAQLAPTNRMHTPEENLSLTEVISQFRLVADEAEMAVATHLGPLVSWSGPRRDDWNLTVTGADLEGGHHGFGDVTLGNDAYEGTGGGWLGGALDCAARAYRREAEWDFAPDETGIWLLMLAPVSAMGGSEAETWYYGGHVVGFVILHDRDEDGEYESVAHIWTAAAWRRRGIARRLLAEARARYSITDVEGPYTEDGGAFLHAEAEEGRSDD